MVVMKLIEGSLMTFIKWK